MCYATQTEDVAHAGLTARARMRLTSARRRLDELAVRAAVRPYASTLALLAVTLVLLPALIGVGEWLFDDPAEMFRELMPATWLSFLELLFAAAAAWAVHLRTRSGRRRLGTFWAVSAFVFVVFAVDEITQATVFAADLLSALGASAPDAFRDLDAVLLSALLAAGALVIARYALDLRSHLRAIPLFAAGFALGVASETLDATLAATSSEFVVEEALKLAAEPFLIGGFLVALHDVDRCREATG